MYYVKLLWLRKFSVTSWSARSIVSFSSLQFSFLLPYPLSQNNNYLFVFLIIPLKWELWVVLLWLSDHSCFLCLVMPPLFLLSSHDPYASLVFFFPNNMIPQWETMGSPNTCTNDDTCARKENKLMFHAGCYILYGKLWLKEPTSKNIQVRSGETGIWTQDFLDPKSNFPVYFYCFYLMKYKLRCPG